MTTGFILSYFTLPSCRSFRVQLVSGNWLSMFTRHFLFALSKAFDCFSGIRSDDVSSTFTKFVFFLIYWVPNEHNRSAEARLLVLNFIVDFALWTQFKLRNDQTKRSAAVITHIQNSCSLFSWVPNWSRFLSHYYIITRMQFSQTFI